MKADPAILHRNFLSICVDRSCQCSNSREGPGLQSLQITSTREPSRSSRKVCRVATGIKALPDSYDIIPSLREHSPTARVQFSGEPRRNSSFAGHSKLQEDAREDKVRNKICFLRSSPAGSWVAS